MRRAIETATGNFSHSNNPPPASRAASCDPQAQNCRWWPYSTSNDFEANTGIIIILLLCALICALALNTAVRWFLRGGNNTSQERRPSRTQQQLAVQQKPDAETLTEATLLAETLTYSEGIKLGGTEAECAICLSEFAEGDQVRVLGRCKHGFHAHCVEQWLSRHSSCPTCRSSCIASSSASSETLKTGDDCCPGNGLTQRAEHERVADHRLASLVPPDLPV